MFHGNSDLLYSFIFIAGMGKMKKKKMRKTKPNKFNHNINALTPFNVMVHSIFEL